MQGHDAHAERARNLALQLSLRRQMICSRELGRDFCLRMLGLWHHRRSLAKLSSSWLFVHEDTIICRMAGG
jgi:hypothetical protein